MSFLHQVLHNISKNLSVQAEDLQILREHVLSSILKVTTVFGGVLLVTNAVPVFQRGDWLFLGIFIIAYSGILICTFVPKIPYNIRAAVIVLVPIGLSLTDIVDYALSGDGMVWLFTSAILTSILFGSRWAIINWAGQAFLLSILAFIILTGRLSITNPDYTNPIVWMDTAIDYVFLGVIVTIGLNILINGLDRSLTTSQTATEVIETHTKNLERRIIQLRTVAEISHSVSAELASENYLQKLVELIQERLNLYYAGVFLVSEDKNFAELKAGTGEPGTIMMSQHHKLEIGGNSMIGWCITHQQPRIALDVGLEAVRFENPLLPLTRSELALPLKSSTGIVGAMTIQSTDAQAFDQDDITVLQSLADSLATAIVNARLLQESQNQLQELNTLYSASLSMYTSVQTQDTLLTIAEHMLKVSETQNYVISSWDMSQNEVVTIFGFSSGEDISGEFGQRYQLSDYPLTEKVLRDRIIVTVRADDPEADQAEVALLKEEGLKSLLMVPLVTHDRVVGLMELHDEINYRNFTPQQLHLVEALSAQAAIVLEITNLFEQNRKVARNEQLINQITSKFQQTLNIEDVMRTTVRELTHVLGLESATIQLGLEETLQGSQSPPSNGKTRNA